MTMKAWLHCVIYISNLLFGNKYGNPSSCLHPPQPHPLPNTHTHAHTHNWLKVSVCAECVNLQTYLGFCFYHMLSDIVICLPALVAQLDAPSDWRPGGRGFNPRRGRQHSFVEIDHEIFSTVILSLPLIQEGQLSVSGERMCTILVNRLED